MFEHAGTVSHATMRPIDLFNSFTGFLAEHYPDKYRELQAESWMPGHETLELEDAPYWESEDVSEDLNSLFDVMDELAPEGYYFGAHPGDGSDYGYWEHSDDFG